MQTCIFSTDRLLNLWWLDVQRIACLSAAVRGVATLDGGVSSLATAGCVHPAIWLQVVDDCPYCEAVLWFQMARLVRIIEAETIDRIERNGDPTKSSSQSTIDPLDFLSCVGSDYSPAVQGRRRFNLRQARRHNPSRYSISFKVLFHIPSYLSPTTSWLGRRVKSSRCFSYEQSVASEGDGIR